MSGTSRPRGAPVSEDRPEMSVKLDYSNIYKENEELEGDLENTIDDIHKNKYRAWVERRHQLKVIKKQVEVIMRLRAAVNARKPGDSIEIVASSRPRRASKSAVSRKKTDDTKEVDPMDVAEMAQNSKTQMRISQEREKFSSKNLFNVRRKIRGGGGIFDNNNNYNFSTQATPFSVEGTGGKLFTKRVAVATHKMGEVSIHDEDYSNSYNDNGDNNNDDNRDDKRPTRPFSDRPRTAYNNGRPKSYMQETQSSRKGGRPKTAMGIASEKGLGTGGESAPQSAYPSRMPSANRCRSRRQLELLSRVNSAPNNEKAKEDAKEEDGSPAWDVINRSRRDQKLQRLRSQGKELQTRVDRFLNDIHRYNSDRDNLNNNRHAGIICLYD